MTMMMLSMNIMFFFMNHPLSMGMILIAQTMIVSIMAGMIMKTFWLSYMLTISMLSGMLVLFIYMSSMASNEKFKNSISLWALFLLMLMVSMLSLFILKKMIIKNNYFSMGMIFSSSSDIYLLNKMFNFENLIITIILVMYLLLTMIVSTHLVNIFEGPMRIKM